MSGKTMIMVAPNGARRVKSDHTAIPLSADELAIDALACAKAGATAIHLHVRDDDGGHILDARRYIEATAAVKQAVGDDFIVQITTEAVGKYSAVEQMDVVRAVKPEAVSVALREIVGNEAGEDRAREFFGWMSREKIAPQFILYEPQEVLWFLRLKEKGVIGFDHPFLLFVLGRYTAGQQSDPHELDPFVAALGKSGFNWAVCAFGNREAECAGYAAKLGGHVRVGFENNLYLPNGDIAPDNSELVGATRDEIVAQSGQIMGQDAARELMGLF